MSFWIIFGVWAWSITTWFYGGASQSSESSNTGPSKPITNPNPGGQEVQKKKDDSAEMESIEVASFAGYSPSNRRRRARRKSSSGASVKELLSRKESKASVEEEIGKEKELPKLERTELPSPRNTPSAVTPPSKPAEKENQKDTEGSR
ncbi:unnamed protein product [Bursaphelenchus okinawaensis]|uniref:Uncharacterized protein n=1 Tax=Bursaphelenchus okinawaensis TaxID=465554 RepID=A0A811LNT1_9BILA|nr:unnamed protein product [Bursaphelenchus okinawaensis]CAG9126352.1 unnamed protein product [Bursaphelenchus okinawaensis]